MKKPRVYIAGKVTGLPEKEVTVKFSVAARHLRAMRMIPLNPIDIVNNPNEKWHLAMRKCIAVLMSADAVLALSDSRKSRGAKIEVFLCRLTKIPVFRDYDSLAKHYGVFSKNACNHPEERQRLVSGMSAGTVEEVKKICLDCNEVLASQLEV